MIAWRRNRTGRRKYFLELVNASKPTLEIGPFYRPMVKGNAVRYFDTLDRDALRKRALELNLGEVDPPTIDYVSPFGDMSIVDRTFENVVSSHCIEHQPDLVRHLQDVGRLLEPGGKYYVIAPDKRYCFDHFVPETSLSDVICAHAQKRTNHTMDNFVRHRSLITHNNSKRHWRGDHVDPGYFKNLPARTLAAADEFQSMEGYVDVHAWQFTPETFRAICQALFDLKLSPLRVVQVNRTPRKQLEFTAILERQA